MASYTSAGAGGGGGSRSVPSPQMGSPHAKQWPVNEGMRPLRLGRGRTQSCLASAIRIGTRLRGLPIAGKRPGPVPTRQHGSWAQQRPATVPSAPRLQRLHGCGGESQRAISHCRPSSPAKSRWLHCRRGCRRCWTFVGLAAALAEGLARDGTAVWQVVWAWRVVQLGHTAHAAGEDSATAPAPTFGLLHCRAGHQDGGGGRWNAMSLFCAACGLHAMEVASEGGRNPPFVWGTSPKGCWGAVAYGGPLFRGGGGCSFVQSPAGGGG